MFKSLVRSFAAPVSKSLRSQQARAFSIHEHSSVELFSKNGVAVPLGYVANTPQEAFDAAKKIGGETVVKAQVLAGGRGKGHFKNGFQGGVHVAKTPEEARDLAAKMIGETLVTKQTGEAGKECQKVFVVEKKTIAHEYYFAILLDRSSYGPVLVASPYGGMDIEGVAEKNPEAIFKLPIDINKGIQLSDAEGLADKLGFKDSNKQSAVNTMMKLYELFIKSDATQIEINPLGETTDGKVLCMDAKLNFDDNAKFRQQDITKLIDATQIDPRETQSAKFGLNYIGLDGDIGCLVNGAGLAMATMDIIKMYGGEPANFLDLGGGANEKTIGEAFKIVTSDSRVNAILVNIFGGIIRCDVVAQGIINAVNQIGLKIPVVVRLQGTNVELGKELLKNSGIAVIPFDGLKEAAFKVVELNKKAEEARK
ncbi:putative succinyl-CoA ligase [GDP-forming] subunit beta, mitochondrial [Smittium mucronatum]|uniref:Succinate--CoA ligase [ADP-forming] subunit beta, mitochondrial n=1 Tax=Smittium mucronatum TaxID=133383 RepID=A0A1R0GVR0_9FUNG|nr:putative succinyl-CoA ligase [GDP-forming] subunit beta, mitochondrial [Smittium mucronatum]